MREYKQVRADLPHTKHTLYLGSLNLYSHDQPLNQAKQGFGRVQVIDSYLLDAEAIFAKFKSGKIKFFDSTIIFPTVSLQS